MFAVRRKRIEGLLWLGSCIAMAAGGTVLDAINPFRTAVPFWGQTTWTLNGLSPKRDCGSKRVNRPFLYTLFCPFEASTLLFHSNYPPALLYTRCITTLSRKSEGSFIVPIDKNGPHVLEKVVTPDFELRLL